MASTPLSLTSSPKTAKKKMTASSIYFQSLPYGLDAKTHLIDYAALKAQARLFKPRLIICGASAYARDLDYKALRETADEQGAFLMADIAHTSGLVAAGELDNPFQYCDVVTTTTCVSLVTQVTRFETCTTQPQDSSWASGWSDLL